MKRTYSRFHLILLVCFQLPLVGGAFAQGPHNDSVINYLDWNGAAMWAKLEGNSFRVKADGPGVPWNQVPLSNTIRYKTWERRQLGGLPEQQGIAQLLHMARLVSRRLTITAENSPARTSAQHGAHPPSGRVEMSSGYTGGHAKAFPINKKVSPSKETSDLLDGLV